MRRPYRTGARELKNSACLRFRRSRKKDAPHGGVTRSLAKQRCLARAKAPYYDKQGNRRSDTLAIVSRRKSQLSREQQNDCGRKRGAGRGPLSAGDRPRQRLNRLGSRGREGWGAQPDSGHGRPPLRCGRARRHRARQRRITGDRTSRCARTAPASLAPAIPAAQGLPPATKDGPATPQQGRLARRAASSPGSARPPAPR